MSRHLGRIVIIQRNGYLLPCVCAVRLVRLDDFLTESYGGLIRCEIHKRAHIRSIHQNRTVGITAILLVIPGAKCDTKRRLVPISFFTPDGALL